MVKRKEILVYSRTPVTPKTRNYSFFLSMVFPILMISICYFFTKTAVESVSALPIIPMKQTLGVASFSGKLTVLPPIDENTVSVAPSSNDQIMIRGPENKKEIAITFDGDMTPAMKQFLESGQVQTYNDTRITQILNDTQTKATFFLTGMWIELYTQATKDMAQNPLFELENHSYSHPSFIGECYGLPQKNESDYYEEIVKPKQLLKDLIGVDNKYFRFPGGCYNKKALDLVNKAGLTVVHWDTVGGDGFNQNTDQIVHNVVDHTTNGSIIVLHLGGENNTPKTAEALPVIIQQLKDKGYVFVKVSDLLQENQTAKSSLLDYFSINKNLHE